ncbi:MAG: transposase [Gammaproteobacteria bacterium]|nr:MAG: transposase [Gammaproteobacteria bacterium]
MPKARKHLISLDTTPHYHIVTRCVRRTFLCGIDDKGNNFEHRRQWIEDKLLALAQTFAIDICAYAIMSNHYHLVLHVDKALALQWNQDEVILRWHQVAKGIPLTHKYLQDASLMTQAELDIVYELAEQWRKRLYDISWFMRFINESTARRGNTEDNCTGRFWEGRFKSQALLDEQALAACMAYVDLNPVRANMAKTPESSAHTSIKRRCIDAKQALNPNAPEEQPRWLIPFVGNSANDTPKGLPFRLTDYIDLVDWTGRCIRTDKRGSISQPLPTVLERLQIEPRHWLYLSRHFESHFKRLVGTAFDIKRAACQFGYKRIPGPGSAIQLALTLKVT